ncbi:hypothetical protein PoB_007362900 [Plakobranchus ocellatus]|uniref:Uncharacterized protein n=1 Tax=Plakobranchus ocellatus TaxID=259542 RepID=A0AAV4DS93_9GAST|nr:hypothetical protein PoB_007362900 [Plakobranchus ocellatus]
MACCCCRMCEQDLLIPNIITRVSTCNKRPRIDSRNIGISSTTPSSGCMSHKDRTRRRMLSRSLTHLLQGQSAPLIKDNEEILERWTEHFDSVRNRPYTIDIGAIDCLPRFLMRNTGSKFHSERGCLQWQILKLGHGTSKAVEENQQLFQLLRKKGPQGFIRLSSCMFISGKKPAGL